MFTPEQRTQLAAPLSRAHVKERAQAGRTLSYIEGWVAIAEANRIFGFDGWTRQTMTLEETNRELVTLKSNNGGTYQQWRVGYLARVRVTVQADAETIIREGTGFGSGMAKPEALGEAIESAAKEAETDAMKRALMTFGNPFGLALYDKTQENVSDAPAPANGHSEPIQQRDLSIHPDGKDFWKCDGPGMTAHYAKKEGFGELHEKMREQIRNLHTDTQRREWIEENLPDIQKMPKSWRVILRADLEEQAQPVAA
jgi:DNA recombination protein Rad52